MCVHNSIEYSSYFVAITYVHVQRQCNKSMTSVMKCVQSHCMHTSVGDDVCNMETRALALQRSLLD